LGAAGVIVSNITLFSVLIYELIGPFLTKVALEKAGEIDREGKKSFRKKHERIHRHHRHDDIHEHHHGKHNQNIGASESAGENATQPTENNGENA
jgi:hypothetical protein